MLDYIKSVDSKRNEVRNVTGKCLAIAATTYNILIHFFQCVLL